MKRHELSPLSRGFVAGLLVLALLLSSRAQAAEMQSIAWERGDAAVLQFHIGGKSSYRTESLEDGQRLRLRFPETSLLPAVSDIEGRALVKGVYPYLTDNGTTVTVDLLLAEPGQMEVEATDYGYRVKVAPGTAAVANGAQAPVATAASQNYIEAITYAKLPGDRLQIRIKTSGVPLKPSEFTISNPPRISVDLPQTKVKMARRSLRIGVGAVSSVTAVEGEDRTRVVFNLVKPVAHVSSIDEGGVTLTIDSATSKIASASNTSAPPKTTQFAVATRPGKHSLKNIDFRRGPAGDAQVIIDLSDPNLGINIYEQSGEIMVDFLDTNVAAEMQRRLDVVDFATPIQTIDTFAQGTNVRMVIKPKGKYEHLAYQAGNVFTVNVKPVVVNKEDEERKKADEFGYAGEKLSLNFQSIEVRAALQVIADFTGLNFVTSDSVKGNLTLRLKDVPWDQALDIIVTSKNLAIRRKGNVVTVAPADEVAAREKLALEATKQVLELEPLVSELIQINYAKAEQIASLLKSIKAVSGSVPSDQGAFSSVSVSKVETESNTLLSPRGQVTVDARTNSLLIQDTPGKLREVRKLIAQLDQPVRQVMIESRLVEASDNFSRSLGVKFGTTNARTTSNSQINQGATLSTTGALTSDGLNVNLPSGSVVAGVSPGSIALTVARLGSSNLLSLELSALEAEGRGKIISSPRLITANQKKASIQQGQEQIIPLGFGKSETKKAVLGLDVTPQITPDDRVIMDVVITKDNFVDAGSSRMNTKQIQTQVLLDNGETVVIGGIYEQDELKSTTQIPFFGDLPLLGHLFKNKSVRDNKTELLIFLTPRILSSSLALR